MVKGGLNGLFWCLGGPWTREGSCMGCLSEVNIATSTIFTEGAWVGRVDGSSSWSDLQRARK
jgi:hypothetical protein